MGTGDTLYERAVTGEHPYANSNQRDPREIAAMPPHRALIQYVGNRAQVTEGFKVQGESIFGGNVSLSRGLQRLMIASYMGVETEGGLVRLAETKTSYAASGVEVVIGNVKSKRTYEVRVGRRKQRVWGQLTTEDMPLMTDVEQRTQLYVVLAGHFIDSLGNPHREQWYGLELIGGHYGNLGTILGNFYSEVLLCAGHLLKNGTTAETKTEIHARISESMRGDRFEKSLETYVFPLLVSDGVLKPRSKDRSHLLAAKNALDKCREARTSELGIWEGRMRGMDTRHFNDPSASTMLRGD